MQPAATAGSFAEVSEVLMAAIHFTLEQSVAVVNMAVCETYAYMSQSCCAVWPRIHTQV